MSPNGVAVSEPDLAALQQQPKEKKRYQLTAQERMFFANLRKQMEELQGVAKGALFMLASQNGLVGAVNLSEDQTEVVEM